MNVDHRNRSSSIVGFSKSHITDSKHYLDVCLPLCWLDRLLDSSQCMLLFKELSLLRYNSTVFVIDVPQTELRRLSVGMLAVKRVASSGQPTYIPERIVTLNTGCPSRGYYGDPTADFVKATPKAVAAGRYPLTWKCNKILLRDKQCTF